MHHYLSQFSELNGPGYVKMAWVYGTGAVSGWAGSSEGSAAQHMPGWPTPWLTAEAVSWELRWGCQPEQLCACGLSIWLALRQVWWLCS